MKKIFLIVLLGLIFPITTLAANNEQVLDSINKIVCDRFEEDLNKMAAIMEEVRARKDITETRVAFGGVDTVIESADYQITFAAEALAYQRAQKYSSKNSLRSGLETLRGKLLRAKTATGKALKE